MPPPVMTRTPDGRLFMNGQEIAEETNMTGDFSDVTSGHSTTGTDLAAEKNKKIMLGAAALFAIVIFWPYFKKLKL